MLKLKPYKELLKMSKEKVGEVLAPVRAKKAEKQAELKIVEMEEKLASLEASIHEECSKENLDFDRIVKMQDEYALTERRVGQFRTIIDEMFHSK